jgi:hypothetical protein
VQTYTLLLLEFHHVAVNIDYYYPSLIINTFYSLHVWCGVSQPWRRPIVKARPIGLDRFN